MLELDRKMKEKGNLVFIKDSSAIRGGGNFRRTASPLAIVVAAELAFHSNPVSSNDIPRIDPLEITKSMILRHSLNLLGR